MTTENSENSEIYFGWIPVLNTTEERSQQNSLSHDVPPGNKIRESTKKLNKYLKKSRPKLYSSFVQCKKNILSKIRTNSDVFNESDFSDSELRTFYDSFNTTGAENSKAVHDDLFVWSFIKKKGMKEESVDVQKDPFWEPEIDIKTHDYQEQNDGENRFNGSFKAAGALLINKQQKKCRRQTHYNTRSASKSFKSNDTSSINVLAETPTNGVENINDSDTRESRNKKLKNAKRNLRSAIENVSSQASEISEANLSCDFIPEDFQAHSTQIFSDTITNSVSRRSSTKKASKFPSNDAINQPKDSGIDEDSRDENGAQQNIENETKNGLLMKSGKKTSRDRKVLAKSKNKEHDSLSSENTAVLTTPHKCLKIIGDETLKKKYKIIGKNNSAPQPLQPIIEEKPASVSESNDKSNDHSKHEAGNDSESDFKSIKSDDEKSTSENKAKESSDEYYDVHDDNNASSSEEEKVSLPRSMEKNENVETDVDSDSQDSRHHRQRVKNKLKESTSPWVAKQYKDLKRLRLLDDSQDDSVIESNLENKSVTIEKQKVSTKNKKTPKIVTNEVEKLSKKSNIKSSKKKSFINGKLLDPDSAMNNPQATHENFDKNMVINSKLNNDTREYSDSDSAGSHRLLQKNKKLKKRKTRRKTSRTDSLSSRENSNDRQTQHDSKDAKSYKDSSQSDRDDDSKENIQRSCDDDAISDVDSEKSTKQTTKSDDSKDSKEDVDALYSKNSSTNRDSSALSINDIVKSKQGKENSVKEKMFTSSDDERESGDEKSTSENQKEQLQNVKKMDLMASGESSDSETERENVDLQNKNESSCQKNEKPSETIEEESYKSDDDVFDGRETKETILPHKENQNKESNEEDEGLPTLQAQEKLQQMKRLTFDDNSDSEVSEAETANINKHKTQVIKSEMARVRNVDEKSEKIHRASSDEGSDEEEEIMSESQKRKLQNFKKMDLMASDESSDSETEHNNADSQNKKESPSRKNERTCEKNTEKSNESDDDSVDGRKSKEITAPRKENQSDESDREDEVLPTQHAQEKLEQMKRLNFDDSSESEDSETESIKIPIHKTQVKKSEIAKERNVDEKSEREQRAGSGDESDEGDTMSEHQKNHLQKMKKMDLMASDESEDSDEEDQISKTRSRKVSDEKIKSEDSEDDDKTSDAALHEKKKLNKKSRNAGSSKDSDSESVHYDSDNIDVKEHKVIIPEDLKNSNLLEQFNESNLASSSISKNDGKSEISVDKKDENELENDEDKEIDNIVPVEISKRMQQLKRLNLYENDDSSDSDESLKNNRNVSQRSSNVPRKERDDSSSDEKESITEEPTTSKSKANESEVNDTKEEIEDDVADEEELEKAVKENNKNVVIPETQESEGFASNSIQSQEMFSSLEDLTENPSRIPPTPLRVSKNATPTKPDREKITEIAELVEQEELIKSSLEPTMTLDDIDSDDDEIFVIEVPKNVFDKEVIGKKLVVTKNSLSIGDAHYEAVKTAASPIMSCVLNSKRKKFKTVNIRPLRSVVARRRKDADDFIENAEMESRHENVKSQRLARESDQESINEARDIEPTSTKKSKSKKRKLSHTDEVPCTSSATLGQRKTSKKKVKAKSNEVDPHDLTDGRKSPEEETEQDEAKKLKRKLYSSDHEIKDVDSNVTDDSLINNSFKKPKNPKKATDTADTSAKPVKRVIRKELTLKKLNVENKVVNENNNEIEVTEQSKSKTKTKKKSNKQTHQETEEESQLEKVANTLEGDKEMFENMFRESFLVNISTVEEEKPVKKKAKKRKNTTEDVSSEPKVKSKKKSKAEEVEDDSVAVAKPKRSRKKVEKPKEEPASVQIMKFINDAFKSNSEKLNASTSSNESRYGALDIERVSTKKNYSSSSSSSSGDENEAKHSRPRFQIRDKSKEKELTTLFKEEVKDEKKKIKKIHFDE